VPETDALELHLEQLVHRQLAAGIRQADNDLVDGSRAHDRGDVLDRPDHAGVDHRRADAFRIRIDEPDDFDPEVRALVELTGEPDGGIARAHEQQAFRRTHLSNHPFEHQAPTEHECEDEAGGKDEDAASDNQVRQPKVQRRKNERGCTDRLYRPYEELAPIGQDAEIVEIREVQAQLRHHSDQQCFRKDLLFRPERLETEAEVHRQAHGTEDEVPLQHDQPRGSPAERAPQDSGDRHQRSALSVLT
jgi:hypothetical protein